MENDPLVNEDWVSFTCHFCRAKLRIRGKYAHLRGRCPDCGIRVEALKPLPYQRPETTHAADEPAGLAPLGEEEWPEPALHDEPEPSYQLVTTPLTFTTEDKPDPFAPSGSEGAGKGETDIIQFEVPAAAPAIEPAPTEARSEEAGELYAFTPGEPEPRPPPPVAEMAPFQLSDAEKKPIRTPPPPLKPLVQGVFNLPWQPGNLRVWLLQAIGFTVLTFLPALIHMFYEQLGTGAFYLAAIFMGVGALFVLLVTGSFAASWFIDILEQTANGADTITWTDISFRDGLVIFLRLVWLFVVTVLLPMVLLSCVMNPLLSFLTLAPVMVPIGILSSLGTGSVMLFISFELLSRLADRPPLFFWLYLQTLPIWGVCATAYYAAITWIDFSIAMWLTPLVGLLLSAGVMIYARLLGRVGMVLTQTADKTKKKRKRKKKRPEDSGTDAVEQGDGERPEDQDRQPGP